jgi:hypothetical protein
MSDHLVNSPERLLRTYFHAKDENRPHLMSQVFSEAATLEMVVKTGTIAFPPVSHGRAAITDVLSRCFAQTYENVYSFYLQRPSGAASSFACDWLVGMSEKADGAVLVGCGRYEWNFQQQAPFLVDRLVITIDVMQVLPPPDLECIMAWLTALPYPWCSANAAIASAPPLNALEPVVQYVGRRTRGA